LNFSTDCSKRDVRAGKGGTERGEREPRQFRGWRQGNLDLKCLGGRKRGRLLERYLRQQRKRWRLRGFVAGAPDQADSVRWHIAAPTCRVARYRRSPGPATAASHPAAAVHCGPGSCSQDDWWPCQRKQKSENHHPTPRGDHSFHRALPSDQLGIPRWNSSHPSSPNGNPWRRLSQNRPATEYGGWD